MGVCYLAVVNRSLGKPKHEGHAKIMTLSAENWAKKKVTK